MLISYHLPIHIPYVFLYQHVTFSTKYMRQHAYLQQNTTNRISCPNITKIKASANFFLLTTTFLMENYENISRYVAMLDFALLECKI